MRKNCSSDREKLLKFEAEGQAIMLDSNHNKYGEIHDLNHGKMVGKKNEKKNLKNLEKSSKSLI